MRLRDFGHFRAKFPVFIAQMGQIWATVGVPHCSLVFILFRGNTLGALTLL